MIFIINRTAIIAAAILVAGIFAGCGQTPQQASSQTPPQSSPQSASAPYQTVAEAAAAASEADGPVPGEGFEEDNHLRVIRESDGHVLRLGDAHDGVASVLGPEEWNVVEFMKENVWRVQYKVNPHIFVDYDMNHNAVLCAVSIEIDDWKLENGLTVGMGPKDVWEAYDAAYVNRYVGTDNLWVGFDENGEYADFDGENVPPYAIRFEFNEDNILYAITVMDNRALGAMD